MGPGAMYVIYLKITLPGLAGDVGVKTNEVRPMGRILW